MYDDHDAPQAPGEADPLIHPQWGGWASDPAVARSVEMFNRVLCSWASDLLHLRREGLAAPGWREQVQEGDGISWRRAA